MTHRRPEVLPGDGAPSEQPDGAQVAPRSGRSQVGEPRDADERFGANTWLEQWEALLVDIAPSAVKASQQGRAAARSGLRDGPVVTAGKVTATVSDRHGPTARVSIGWHPPPVGAWTAAARRLASQVRLTAPLLEKRLTGEVVDELHAAGIPLIPAKLGDLSIACSVGDGPLCRHCFAVLHALVARFAIDAGLLLRFRGRDFAGVLSDIRRVRGSSAPSAAPVAGGGSLDDVKVRPRLAHDPTQLLRDLGLPPGVDNGDDLGAAIRQAASMAWRLAAGDGTGVADEQLVLAELRALHAASAATVAEALGINEDDVRQVLDDLYSRGAVLRTGTGATARYRAS